MTDRSGQAVFILVNEKRTRVGGTDRLHAEAGFAFSHFQLLVYKSLESAHRKAKVKALICLIILLVIFIWPIILLIPCCFCSLFSRKTRLRRQKKIVDTLCREHERNLEPYFTFYKLGSSYSLIENDQIKILLSPRSNHMVPFPFPHQHVNLNFNYPTLH